MKKYKNFVNENLVETFVPIGNFEIKSGKVMVSDPCYKRETWCQGILDNVVEGTWDAYVKKSDEKDWGIRVAELVAVKNEYTPDSINFNQIANFQVGVDSGQAGIFDEKYYRDDKIKKFKYKTCRKISHEYIHRAMEIVLKEFKEMGITSDQINKDMDIMRNYYKRMEEVRKELLRDRFHEEVDDDLYEVVEKEYIPKGKKDEWYDMACTLTDTVSNPPGIYKEEQLEYDFAGCMPNGCVSMSGFGDDIYQCFYSTIQDKERVENPHDPYGEEDWENNAPIIAIKIVFIGQNENEEDNWDAIDDFEAGNIPYEQEGFTIPTPN
jgi:hypothetical protein